MIAYLICADEHAGFAEAEARGWKRIAFNRYVTDERDDIRVISRAAQLAPMAGQTNLIKGGDYEDGPADEGALVRWIGGNGRIGEKDKFDDFVATGNGVWLDIDSLHPIVAREPVCEEF